MRKPFAFAALALLASCSLPRYEIVAHRIGAATVFEGRAPGKWPFKHDDNSMPVDLLTVRDAKRVVWRIERGGDPGCTPPAQVFPLVYGRVPRCYVASVPAAVLSAGQVYRVTGRGGNGGEGVFRYGNPIANLDAHETASATADWFPVNGEMGPPIAADSNIQSANIVIEAPPE